MNHGFHGKWHSWRNRFSHVFPFHDWNRKGALSTATYSTPAISSPIVVIVEKATGLKNKKQKKNMTWQVKVSLGRNEPEIIRNWAAARASILRPQIGWGKIFFQHAYWKRFQKLHSRMSSLNLFAFSSQSLLKTALASPIRTRYVWVDPERNLIKNYPYFITSSYLKAHDSCGKQDFRDVFGYRAGNPHCWAFGYGWGRHRHCVPMPRMKLNPQLWVLSTPTMIRRI